MPAPLPAPKTVKAVVSGTWNGIPWANIFHIQYTGTAPSGSNLASLAGHVGASWSGNWGALMTNTMSKLQVLCTDLDTITGAQGADSTATPGGLAVFTGPNSIAPVVNWHAPTRYRGGHPKTFLPGIPDSNITGGLNLTDAFRTNVALGGVAFLGDMAGFVFGPATTVGLCVVHYHRGHAVLAPPQVELISSLTVRHLIGSMRGRRT